MIHSHEKGQTLLIVVLVMVVSLTIGLSVASRSITNLRTTTEEENSQRAFSAAEAGIEQVLKKNTEITELPLGNNTSIKKAKPTDIGGSEFLLNSGNLVSKDDGADVWFVAHNSDGTLNYTSGWQQLAGDAKLTVYWGSSADVCDRDVAKNTMAGIEIIVISGSNGNPVTTRYAVDPCANRRSSNAFSTEDETGLYNVPQSPPNKTFRYRKTIDIRNTSKGIVVRIVPLYAASPIGVKGCSFNSSQSCNEFPSQGKRIESTGTSGGTDRKVTFLRGYPKLPSEFFGYILFSP